MDTFKDHKIKCFRILRQLTNPLFPRAQKSSCHNLCSSSRIRRKKYCSSIRTIRANGVNVFEGNLSQYSLACSNKHFGHSFDTYICLLQLGVGGCGVEVWCFIAIRHFSES